MDLSFQKNVLDSCVCACFFVPLQRNQFFVKSDTKKYDEKLSQYISNSRICGHIDCCGRVRILGGQSRGNVSLYPWIGGCGVV
jgi:hypothetical protein